MAIISPFTPLFFNVPKSDGLSCEYIQTFSTEDTILLQVICQKGESCFFGYREEPEHINPTNIPQTRWDINDDIHVRFATLRLSPGYYSVYVSGLSGGTRYSEIFRVTDDPEELENTTLIQYSNLSNRERTDTAFFINGMQYYFEFRVPGGFKDANWSFGVDGEQFTSQSAEITQLYGRESTQKVFTMGAGAGVPIWFGELLNRILVCDRVYFDGQRFVRKESSVPEITNQLEGINSFVFNQSLQQCHDIDPTLTLTTQTLLRSVGGDDFRVTETDQLRQV